MFIDILRIKSGAANCYALMDVDTRRSILVDAGNPGDKDAVLRGMARYGISPGALELVLLTHNHPDHTGAAQYLRARGIPTAMHPADSPQPGELHRRGVFGSALLTVSRRMVGEQQPFTADTALEDGQSLAPYGIDAAVVHLPGHTAGSVGVLLGDGRLVCGDTFMNFLRPSPAHIAEDFALLDKTVAALRARGVTTVYPGHGKPFRLSRR